MSHHEIRFYDYVNQPYEPVRDALRKDAPGIFRQATRLAETRSGEVVAALSVEIGGFQLSKDIELSVGEIHEQQRGGDRRSRVLHVPLSWRAAESPRLFPVLEAEFLVYPLSSSETQVELHGHYDPPLGAMGSAFDAIVGHRLAEASVHRFVRAVVERLRQQLATGT